MHAAAQGMFHCSGQDRISSHVERAKAAEPNAVLRCVLVQALTQQAQWTQHRCNATQNAFWGLADALFPAHRSRLAEDWVGKRQQASDVGVPSVGAQ